MYMIKMFLKRSVAFFNIKYQAKYILTFLLLMLWSVSSASATEYDIGGGTNDYLTMSALFAARTLQPGDIVNIYPGVYTDEWDIKGTGDTDDRVVIRGVDSNGNPITSPQETVIFDYKGSTDNIPIFFPEDSDYITLQGICVRNWDNHNGQRLIRVEGNQDIFRYILFKDNEHMILAFWNSSDGGIIEFCEFSGGSLATAYDHVIYSFSKGRLTVQHCYFNDLDGDSSSLIKSRDWETFILYNYFEMGTAQTGINANQAEGNEGGFGGTHETIIIGNVFVKKAGTDPSRAFIHHGDDNFGDRPGNLTVANNTFVDLSGNFGTGSSGGFFAIATDGVNSVEVSNNIIYTTHNTTQLSFAHHGPLTQDITGTYNWIKTGASATLNGLTNSLEGSDPGFVDGGDYHLSSTSACINAGYGLASVQPSYQYVAHANREERTIVSTQIDIGAHEYIIINPPQNLRIIQ